jgi:uncharacterized protein
MSWAFTRTEPHCCGGWLRRDHWKVTGVHGTAPMAGAQVSITGAWEGCSRRGSQKGMKKRGKHMAGKFQLKKGSTGKYHFNLLAGNGQVIATSESYESKRSALNGIESVKANAPGAPTEDQTGE